MSDRVDPPTAPRGEVYDWYRRGLDLLAGGNPDAALSVLEHAVAAEPDSAAIGEAVARAQYDAGRYPDAHRTFSRLVERDPADDYAHFGLGLSAGKLGDLRGAVEHLALASALRPDLSHYRTALHGARVRLGRADV